MSRNDDIGYVELSYNGEKQNRPNYDAKEYKVSISSDGKKYITKRLMVK